MTETVRLEVADGVARVTIDRPEVRNALTSEVAAGIEDAIEGVESSDARCIALAGSSGVFCAGGDVEAMLAGVENDTPVRERVERVVGSAAAAVRAVATCELPTVAVLDGVAYGGGASLATACDVRLASEDAEISFGYRQVGLSVDAGASHFLPRIVGEGVAKELVYTGELVGAERAADLGLFNRVCPTDRFETEVDAFLDRVASGPTVALSNSKRLIEAGARRSLDEAIDAETAAQALSASTDDHIEGVRAFVEHRDPAFEGE